MNKTKAERAHAKKRARERYGIELTGELRRQLFKLIRDGQAIFLKSNRISILDIPVDGRRIRIVYDKIRHEIMSFLPENSTVNYVENSESNLNQCSLLESKAPQQ